MKKIIISLSLLALSSCITDAHTSKFTTADFGELGDYRAKIAQYLNETAINPDSIKILNISTPVQTYIQNTGLSGLTNPIFPRWGTCVKYIGGNVYGGKIVSSENFYIKNNHVNYESITPARFEPCNIM